MGRAARDGMVVIGIRMPADVLELLRAEAELRGLSFSELVRRALVRCASRAARGERCGGAAPRGGRMERTSFKAPADVVELARKVAQEEGVSVSEVVRAAVAELAEELRARDSPYEGEYLRVWAGGQGWRLPPRRRFASLGLRGLLTPPARGTGRW